MFKRSVVAFVGDDATVRSRAERATETLRGGSESPEFTAFGSDELIESPDSPVPLMDVPAVVTTAKALADEKVRNHLHEFFDHAFVVSVVDDVDAETVRRLLDSGVDDVVMRESTNSTEATSANDPLVNRLSNAVERQRPTLPPSVVDRLDDVLLDAGTTLMSAHTDEVKTKINWTMANVGDTADLDRICCYVRDGEMDRFDPVYEWSRANDDSTIRPLSEFPEVDRLETFENVVRSFVPDRDPAESEKETRTSPPATVHVPLVVDWELIGVVGFETDDPRLWTDEEVDLYRTFGDLIAYTIARTERRIELRQQTERLEQFSAVVSHDLRNPLNVLSGYLELIEDDISASKFSAMDRALNRMETLIDDLLVLARDGDTIGDTEPVSVTATAERAWSLVRVPNATLTIAEDIGEVTADPNRLQQLFENLFRNAVDHGGAGVTVEVGPRSDSSGGKGMYVADDGPGFPSDAKDSLFDSGFSTADSSGIGLAIVQRISDAHGWQIDVRNDDGAVFDFSFEPKAEATVS